MCAPILDDLDEELEHLLGCDAEPFSVGGQAERGHGGVGPLLELLAAIGWDPEHLGDDGDRQWVR